MATQDPPRPRGWPPATPPEPPRPRGTPGPVEAPIPRGWAAPAVVEVAVELPITETLVATVIEDALAAIEEASSPAEASVEVLATETTTVDNSTAEEPAKVEQEEPAVEPAPAPVTKAKRRG